MKIDNQHNETAPRIGWFWWIKQIALVGLGGFYLYFGIQLLVSAYQLNDPFAFLLTFFASNFIILISGALLVGFVYQMITVVKYLKKHSPP